MVTEQQSRHAIGLFSKRQDAEQFLNELNQSGVNMERVSLIAQEVQEEEEGTGGIEVSDRLGEHKISDTGEMVKDTFVTGATGFFLLGLTSLAIPGVGVLLAAGSLGAALIATVSSSGVAALSSHNLVQALKQYGIPAEEASVYGDRLQQGDYLVSIEGSEQDVEQAENLFQQQGIQNWGVYPTAAG
ncbi:MULTISPECIES: hypothetical protein [unclassified Leptolyngbya]|uniref:hypothetical protein n=1 Tax=unclassified Leptolyngbya TaxID=2650499 RepID=UPI00168921B2|nr:MULTISPECIES: hypothetical protein [unclassified Leptolyngbya]MBD1909948.1 hypothetical protein [Leptolyngbya sp. FACHB-8]MBD2154951.1 hypothetical protein [Leptolyngbya sp. FACHB-16]